MNEELFYLEKPTSSTQKEEEFFLENPVKQEKPSYDAKKYGMGAVYEARNAPPTDIGPLRHVVRTGARIAEGAVGAVGGLAKLGLGAVDYATKKLGSHKGLLQDTVETEGTHLADLIPEALSSSEGFREAVTKPMFGKAQEAQGETEQFFDDWADLTGSLAVPIPGLGGLKLARAAGLAGAGATAGFLARNYAPEGFEAPAKAGGVLAASLLSHKFAGKFPSGIMKTAYKDAEEALKEPGVITSLRTDSTKGKEFINEMDTLSKRGRLGSSKGVYKQFRDAAFNEGRMDIGEVQNLKRELNDIYGEQVYKNKMWAKELKGAISKSKDVLQEYGETYNPKYIAALTKGDEMYGAFAGAKKIRDLLPGSISKYVRGASNEVLGAMLGFPGGIMGSIKGAAIGAGIHSIDTAQSAIQASFRSPNVRKAYGDLLSSVMKDNKAQAIKALNELNNALNKQND